MNREKNERNSDGREKNMKEILKEWNKKITRQDEVSNK